MWQTPETDINLTDDEKKEIKKIKQKNIRRQIVISIPEEYDQAKDKIKTLKVNKERYYVYKKKTTTVNWSS